MHEKGDRWLIQKILIVAQHEMPGSLQLPGRTGFFLYGTAIVAEAHRGDKPSLAFETWQEVVVERFK